MNAKIVSFIGRVDCETTDYRSGDWIQKSIAYYLLETSDVVLIPENSVGIRDARWFCEEDLELLRMYDEVRSMVRLSIDLIRNNHNEKKAMQPA